MSFDEFLKDSKMEFQVYFKSNTRSRINHVLGYISRRLDKEGVETFINDYISYLEQELKPLGRLPKVEDVNLINLTINNLKTDYLKQVPSSLVFYNPEDEKTFKIYLSEFNETKAITYATLYNEFKELNKIKCIHEVYAIRVCDNFFS